MNIRPLYFTILKYLFLLSCCCLLSNCQIGNDEINTKEFLLKEGFKIELVAAEPLLKAPVAIDFDLKGRIWAVEMTGYMRDIDGNDEHYPDGRICFLKDNDQDGVMDEKVVFLDSLILPRAVKCYNNGVLYAEPPNLWWVEVKDDDTPGERILVDSMYTNGGNVEHMPNGLLYNMDNWIYNAKSDRRYQYKNGKWVVEPTIYRGQWGITHDGIGRLFYNDNSNPLFGDYILPNSMEENVYLEKEESLHQNIAGTRKFYPYQATAVNRGYSEGVLMPDGKVSMFTSACSPLIVKGSNLGPSIEGNAFVCGPEANLIKRYQVYSDSGKIKASMTDTISEFIVSKDETFRPVNLNEGPDGSMYIVDMRKGIIQHRAYLTTYLIDLIKNRKLDQYNDGGRIYRVSQTDHQFTFQDYSALNEDDWVDLLNSDKYWERIKAQEYLVVNANQNVATKITKSINQDLNPKGIIHSLWTLDGMDLLDSKTIQEVAESSQNLDVMNTCLYLIKKNIDSFQDAEITQIFNSAKALQSDEINLSIAHLAGISKRSSLQNEWEKLASSAENNELFNEVLLSGMTDISSYIDKIPETNLSLTELAQQTLEYQKIDTSFALSLKIIDVTDPRTKGLFLYHQYCATCHGRDGKGIESVAPPLYESPFLNGPSEQLVLITLQGMTGPLEMNGVHYEFNAAMPGIKNNPELDDEKIRDILLWIRNSFSSSHEFFTTDMVAEMRSSVEGRDELFTQEELEKMPFNQIEN